MTLHMTQKGLRQVVFYLTLIMKAEKHQNMYLLLKTVKKQEKSLQTSKLMADKLFKIMKKSDPTGFK